MLVENGTNYELSDKFLEKLEQIQAYVLEQLEFEQKEVEFLLVDGKKIHSLNLEFRGVDKTTDVLSFPLESEFSALLGSVVISIDLAKEVSTKLGHSVDDEIALLFVHGLLHLAGFDHECDNGEQRELEKQIILAFNLPQSLIIRSELE